MTKQRRRYRLKVILALIPLLLVNGGWIAAGVQSDNAKLPPGRWTFSAGPYLGQGRDTAPVQVYSVTTDADKGLMVSRVTLVNRAAKGITGVRLHWYLTEERNPGRVLLEGDTDLIGTWLAVGRGRVLNYPVISFGKLHKPLLKKGSLNGDYRLEIAVSEVKYEDES